MDAAHQVQETLKPLGGHAVFLLLVQLALLLLAARLGAELAKRMGLPAVVGELAAGIVLGPTVLGHYFPGAFAAIFPHSAAQFHLLEVVGTLGMVLLLLLTGLETDLRLLRNLGRAALIASAMGMVFPFATGFGLGLFMPDAYLAQPDRRILFSFFLATAMAISAMPVIAKILHGPRPDQAQHRPGHPVGRRGRRHRRLADPVGHRRRGLARRGAARAARSSTLAAHRPASWPRPAFVLYPACALADARRHPPLPHARHRPGAAPDRDLLAARRPPSGSASTRCSGPSSPAPCSARCPQLKPETRPPAGVVRVRGPGAGLLRHRRAQGGPAGALGGGRMLALVLAVACLGKLVGCTLGSIWGGLRFWEGLSIAVAMNARGAMELVVATIGLSLGILNQQMFSIIVVVAIVTSFMAPLGLRLTMRKVRMTDEEQRRILAEATQGRVRSRPGCACWCRPRAVPTPPAPSLLAAGLAQRSANPSRC